MIFSRQCPVCGSYKTQQSSSVTVTEEIVCGDCGSCYVLPRISRKGGGE